jgi:hypothetical protein
MSGSSGYCFVHDPALIAQRTAANQKGGEHSAQVSRLRRSRLSDVLDRLHDAMQEMNSEKFDHVKAAAMASVARAIVAVMEAGEMEERLRILEDRNKQSKYSIRTLIDR